MGRHKKVSKDKKTVQVLADINISDTDKLILGQMGMPRTIAELCACKIPPLSYVNVQRKVSIFKACGWVKRDYDRGREKTYVLNEEVIRL